MKVCFWSNKIFPCSSQIIEIICETDFEPKISKNQDWSRKLFSKSRKIWIIVTILIKITNFNAQKSASASVLCQSVLFYVIMTSSCDFCFIYDKGVHVHPECTLSLGTLGMTFDTRFKIFVSRKMISSLSGGLFRKNSIISSFISSLPTMVILCTPLPRK